MNGVSLMLKRTTSKNTRNAISSQGSEDGVTPSVSQTGPTKDLFGQEVAPVSHSVPPGSNKAKAMIDTYGRLGIGSSESENLQRSLESKLQVRLPSGGLTTLRFRWKRLITPLLRRYCQLAALALPIEGIDSGLWLTPMATDGTNGGPNQTSHGRPSGLSAQVHIWPTPTANEDAAGRPGSKMQKMLGNHPAIRDPSLWPTPQAGAQNEAAHNAMSGDFKRRFCEKAGIPMTGTLNPAWVAWLMGYPQDHINCAPTETPSSRKSRKRS